MEQQVMTTQTRPMMSLTVGMPVSIRIRKNTPPAAPAVSEMPEIKLPPRGTTGPVHISKLLEPLQQIIHHPDRNRLLAEFLKDA
ncbi:hypothetical protein [Parabacteroides goldsteinii]|uniref:hypothetical protein n=1 Tax=Parabacteroides goldsteinii TaxID=328812 RepID=UPI0034A3CA81